MNKKYIAVLIVGVMILSGCGKKETVYINTNTQTESKTAKTTVFMVAMNDKKIQKGIITNGCNDSIVPVGTAVGEYDALDPVASVTAAFSALQSMKEEEYKSKNLQNPVAKSTLKLLKVEKGNNNELTVGIDGKFTFDNACDALRQRAQIEQLITSAAPGKAIAIVLNGTSGEWEKSFNVK